MKKLILLFIALLFIVSSIAFANYYGVVARKNANYCSSLSWPILTDANFLLDVDNTDNDLYACIDSGTETGDVNTAHCTPGTVSNGSGGQAICSGSGIIQYDNTGTYVDLRQGEISGTIWVGTAAVSLSAFVEMGDNAVSNDAIRMAVSSQEYLYIAVVDGGTAVTSTSIDISSYIEGEAGEAWVDFQCQWDQSRDTGDEVTCRIRVQDGTPTWEAWSNSTDADTFTFDGSNQPGADEVDFGGIANNHDIDIDDIEIKNSISSWEF